jgi:rhamnogalacturonyl hydrolase YesR
MTRIVKTLRKTARLALDELKLPARARAARSFDRKGLPQIDPGPQRAIAEGLSWLCYAQDHSASRDNGVARHFSLTSGWSSSYPETTGYIADTLFQCGEETGAQDLNERARKMLDWLVSIQFEDGAFQGGMVDQLPKLPATFDTGQILIGLTAGACLDERYRAPMMRAANWLLETQDADGCWRKINTPFAAPGEKVYETHVSIGLFRAAAVEVNRGYLEAATKQVDWALGQQRSNGWFAQCCLTDQKNPLTHTLGYALRGVVEAYLATRNNKYLDAACRTADGLLTALDSNGRLPGRLDERWQAAADWVCLTGTAQVAESLLLLSDPAKRDDYKRAAKRANSFVRRSMLTEGPPEMRGGIKGSFPVDGWYGKWQLLNWACKFMIDANRAELKFGK